MPECVNNKHVPRRYIEIHGDIWGIIEIKLERGKGQEGGGVGEVG